MLRKIRIVLAALCFILITLLFVGIGHDWWGFLAKLQATASGTTWIAGPDGLPTIEGLPAGTYIIKNGKTSYKVAKK